MVNEKKLLSRKNFKHLSGKHLGQSSFISKVHGYMFTNFLEKASSQLFSMEYYEIFQNSYICAWVPTNLVSTFFIKSILCRVL